MKKYLFLLYLFFLSGCLLTHKEITEDKSRAVQEEDWLEQETSSSDQKTDQKTDKTPQLKKKNLNSLSVMERMSQLETDLRELRGQIDKTNKQKEDRLAELEQGLLALIQSLDLRLVALTEEVKAKKKDKKAESDEKKKPSSEEYFNKAEKFFQSQKWKEAIIHYEKYREKNKKNKKKLYVKSTLQIGFCFQELNMHKEAKVFFREVVESFPKSAEAKEAKILLKKAP